MSKKKTGSKQEEHGQISLEEILKEYSSQPEQYTVPKKEPPELTAVQTPEEGSEGKIISIPLQRDPGDAENKKHPDQKQMEADAADKEPTGKLLHLPRVTAVSEENGEKKPKQKSETALEDEEDREEPIRRRKERPLPPDTPPAELAARYAKGLGLLRIRIAGAGLLTLLQGWILFRSYLPVPAQLTENVPLLQIVSLLFYAGVLLLGFDVWKAGITCVLRNETGMSTLVSFSCMVTLADGIFCLIQMPEVERELLCPVSSVAFLCAMIGEYQWRQGGRIACRFAAVSKAPQVLAKKEKGWSGEPVYRRCSGTVEGIGRAMQMPDRGTRIFWRVAPLLLLAAVLLALISSVGRGEPEAFLWCLAVICTAMTPAASLLSIGMPLHRLNRRLTASGAILLGFYGGEKIGRDGRILLCDTDLFPAGTVSITGMKVFGEASSEKNIAYAASVIQKSGSGLAQVFHDLLREAGATYRHVSNFRILEGGCEAHIRDEWVLVGSADFMKANRIPMPSGLSVKRAVFCAIDGELQAVFALHYQATESVRGALLALLRDKRNLILCTKDFNLTPELIEQRFKLSAQSMEYPPLEKRMELSEERVAEKDEVVALVFREGMVPIAETVIGGRRLLRAIRRNTVFCLLASVVGELMAYYLTFARAYDAASPQNLIIFLLMWLIPVLVTSGGVTQY